MQSSWNVLFKPGVSQAQKDKTIEEIKRNIREFYDDYNKKYRQTFVPQFDSTYYCPCDSTLYNLNFHCIDGSGNVVKAPQPKPASAKGDLLDILLLNNNNELAKNTPPIEQTGSDSLNKNFVFIDTSKAVDDSVIVGVIDSGIDTTLYRFGVQHLIWSNNNNDNKPVIYNFIPGGIKEDLSDPGRNKHGSAVIALLLKPLEDSKKYPKIMVLKALDSNDKGSTFSVSCALKYAVLNHASLINASLGYFGETDSVLLHYVSLTASHKPNAIELFVAAGNTMHDMPHIAKKICVIGNNKNELGSPLLSFPACFSQEFTNITSVTQLNDTDSLSPCFYQYYSNKFVSIGVLNKEMCCSFRVDFRQTQPEFYEGSSFATPVATGIKAEMLLNSNSRDEATRKWIGKMAEDTLKRYTIDGKYLIFKTR